MHKTLPLISLLLILALISKPASAEMLFGYVVAISSGNTITLLEGSSLQHKIKISGIEAPEEAQPFGDSSKENLTMLALGKPAAVEWSKLDRHGRIIGKVTVNGRDLGLRQIEAGLAWHRNGEEQNEQNRASYQTPIIMPGSPAWDSGGIPFPRRIGITDTTRQTRGAIALTEPGLPLLGSEHQSASTMSRLRPEQGIEKPVSGNRSVVESDHPVK